MEKSKPIKLPHFKSLDKLSKFFDTRDMGEYWDQMPDVQFDVDLKRRIHLFSLDVEIENKLTSIAKSKKVPSEKLINTWLREKLQDQMKKMKEESLPA